MGKGEETREHILEKAAGLFNTKGYVGASLADVMDATGLQKGGIYRHFGSKEQLALDAFDFAVTRMRARFTTALEGPDHALDRLRAIIDVFAMTPTNPAVPGGCPVLNAAIDTDDGNPALRTRVRAAMDDLRGLVRRVVLRGVKRGELRPGVDAEELATVVTATLEGAIMLAQLYGDPKHVERARAYLLRQLEAEVMTSSSP